MTIARLLVRILPVSGVVCALVLTLIASYSSLNNEVLNNNLQLGLLSSALALLILSAQPEWGPQTGHRWVWSPFISSVLSLVAGQYLLALDVE